VAENYEIKLPQFEGPFDLLLFFIERDELDIHNIPIAKITADFLEYMHHMQDLNIEMASEFILVAATLMRIKAKMLLPRFEKDEEGNEIDPRQDLIRQLLEYKRYKEVSEELKKKEEERIQKFARGNLQTELAKIAVSGEGGSYIGELDNLTLYRLLTSFEKVMERFRDHERRHRVYQYPYTVEEQRDHIAGLLQKRERVSFETIFEHCKNKLHAIFTFLALLDVLQQKLASLIAGNGFNNFWIKRPDSAEANLN
jgi:segregation and condensation protein A